MWGLGQLAILVRVLDLPAVEELIAVQAFALYLAGAELGLSKVAFVRVRGEFLSSGDGSEWRRAEGLLALTVAVVLGASIVVPIVDTVLGTGGEAGRVLRAGYFALVAWNWPLMHLRSLSIAVDEFLAFETVDVVRRIAVLALMVPTIFGFPISVWLFISLAVTLATTMWTWHRVRSTVRSRLGPVRMHGIRWVRDWTQMLRDYGPDAAYSAVFNLSERFGFLLVYPGAFLLGGAGSAVLADITYKVYRGAVTVSQVVSDLLIGGQTNALSEGDSRRAVRLTLRGLWLALAPMAVVAIAILTVGASLLGFLVDDAVRFSSFTLGALALVTVAVVPKNAAVSLLVYAGWFKRAARLGAWMIGASAVAIMLSWMAGIRTDEFLLVYSILMALGGVWFLFEALSEALSSGDAASRVAREQSTGISKPR